MFSSGPPRRSGVAWLEPGRRRRRGRGGVPAKALLVVLVLVAAAGAAVWFVVDRHHAADMRRAAAERFAAAWARRDPAGMWLMLDDRSRAAYPRARFVRLVRIARRARPRSRACGSGTSPRRAAAGFASRSPCARAVRDAARHDRRCPVHDRGRRGARSRWAPHLRLPGLRPGEQVAPPRARAADARRGARRRRPAARPRAGAGRRSPARRRRATSRGSGLERALRRAPRRPPGRASCASATASSRTVKGRRGPLGARDDPPGPAARGRSGARQPARRRRRAAPARRLGARARRASPSPRPQPPGSTFKIITLSAALAGRDRHAVERLSGAHGGDAVGRQAAQRERRVVRRDARQRVRRLVQLGVRPARREARRQAPRAPRRGASASTSAARPRRQGEHDPAAARAEGQPRGRRGRDRPGPRPRHAAADGRASARRSPSAACARRPRIVRSDKVHAPPRGRARRSPAQVRDDDARRRALGHRHGGRDPRRRGRRQDRHRRAAARTRATPKDTDAWFVAFAPASKPKRRRRA